MTSKKKTVKSSKSSYVDAARFVQTWITSSTVLEVSEKLNLPYPSVRVRANVLISKKVELPDLPSGVPHQGRKKTDVVALNKMIKEVIQSVN